MECDRLVLEMTQSQVSFTFLLIPTIVTYYSTILLFYYCHLPLFLSLQMKHLSTVNCQRFLDKGAMDYFMKCVTVFPTQAGE